MSLTSDRFMDRLTGLLWAVAMIGLPFTSFPPFVNRLGAIVAPFSALPVFILLLIWLIPYLLKGKPFPKESLPLLLFIVIALIASTGAFFIEIPSFKGKSITSQELRALLTLIIGLGFYFLLSTYPADQSRLRKTVQWIEIGGIFLIIWTAIQAYYLLFHASHYSAWFSWLQEITSAKTPFFYNGMNRVSGMAYEPSWFAHQMVMLYLPIWLAATYQRTSAFRLRVFHLSLENILLPIGLVEFLLSSPRISLVALFFIFIYLFFKLNVSLYRRIIGKFSAMSHQKSGLSRPQKAATAVLLGISFFAIYAAIVAGSIAALSKRDERIGFMLIAPPKTAEVLKAVQLDENTLLLMANRFAFMERVAYWFTGFRTFNEHPWLGVGLGNSGFFAPQNTPVLGWATYEIRDVLFRSPSLPNIKSLWVRLLAETGLIGFGVFLSWLVSLWLSAHASLKSQDSTVRLLSLAGQLALLAFVAEGFSIDSFAMPYLWVIAGLISGSGMLARSNSVDLTH